MIRAAATAAIATAAADTEVAGTSHMVAVDRDGVAGLAACLGYSEPDAGSDVAAVGTRAVRDGDEWVINGQKMFTTMAHEAAYVFLRRLENRLQMLADQQTHTVPTNALTRERLALAMGFPGWPACAAELEAHRARVTRRCSSLPHASPNIRCSWRRRSRAKLRARGTADVEQGLQQPQHDRRPHRHADNGRLPRGDHPRHGARHPARAAARS